MSWNAQISTFCRLFPPLPGKEDGTRCGIPSPNPGVSSSNHRWIFMGMTEIPGATVCLFKKGNSVWEAAPASSPVHFFLLQLLSPCLELHFDFFPGCFSVSIMTLWQERNALRCGEPVRSGRVVQALWHRRQAQPVIYFCFTSLLKTPRSSALSVLMVWLGWQYLPCRVVVIVFFR